MKIFKPHILDSHPYVGGSTREKQDDGKQVFKLSSNENPLGASPMAVAAIRRALDNLHEYQYHDDGLFLEKLSAHFEGELLADQFLPANSGLELLDIICRGFLSPGTSCILSSPTFMAYKNFAELAGATVVDVPLHKENYMLDVRGIISAIDDTTRVIFVANPNNPTGSLFPDRDIRALAAAIPDHVVLVYDEAYHHYVERRDYVRATEFIAADKNVIGLHSFSKAFGLAALRLGYLFSTPKISSYLRHFRRPFMISSLAMEAGMAALDDHDHLARTIRTNSIEKRLLYKELNNLGIPYWSSDANFILIHPQINSLRFCQYLLQNGVMVRSAIPLGAPGLVRISIGTREMNEALVKSVYNLHYLKVL